MAVLKYIILASALIGSTNVIAEDEVVPTASEMPERISFLVAFGDEKCREPEGDEIVVCATVPENERYRIPLALRKKERVVTDRSWSSAVQTLDSFAADLRPNSCSVNGTGGFTGCTQKMLQQWFAERRSKQRAN
ncbi:hypothetical protein [Sphingorhabdus contaminans]|uniref:UrcA family protein n=1 Tax=Sphingorhabdus contaminans TaxID=1343899 RepID=A0A553WJB3_9SPHN|nr:hypothetical protein [Sphingorhabdus contaminans]TSB04797.1 hypothetical protein FOM92_05160 [Sphingorhabdus contaminans]